jgi:c(7)-type cytochrome triheme protein
VRPGLFFSEALIGPGVQVGRPALTAASSACDDSRRVEPGSACARCHVRWDPARARQQFEDTVRGLPRDRFGPIDRERAESAGQIRPADFLEGLSIARNALTNKREATSSSKGRWMSDVLFSHPKQAVWNGCEVCHPDIFPNSGGPARRYTMMTISAGEACRACHDKVAFPLADCERCHVKPVR